MGDGFPELPLSGQRSAQLVVRIRVVGLEAHRLGIMRDGFSKLPLVVERESQVAVGLRKVRPEA